MKEERLFEAIGAAEIDLLARSERRRAQRRSIWRIGGGVAAACFVCAVLAVFLLPRETPVPPDPETNLIRQEGTEVGSFHLFQLCYAAEVPETPGKDIPASPYYSVDFSIYLNEELYVSTEQDGAFVIYPLALLGNTTMPECKLEIVHQSNITPDEALALQTALLEETYATVSPAADFRPDLAPSLHASDGTAWDDRQADLWCVDDRNGGIFLLTATYFTEATEGHGARFADMVNTFRVADAAANAASPAWVASLKRTATELMDAFFADRPQDAASLLTEDAIFATYGQDVSGAVSVAAIDYTVDDDQDPARAIVSVTHRVNLEDSYNYLIMELTYEDGAWRAAFAGLEK